MIKIKIKAALIHLTIGLLVLAPILTYILLVWYPSPIFEASGLKKILYIFLTTDLILGPILTFIVFKPTKRTLKLDLSIIAFFQVAALAYGLFTIYLGHPAYIVYTVDRFTLATPKDISLSNRFSQMEAKFLGQPTFVYAKSPEDPQAKQKIALEVLSGLPDIDHRPEYYVDFYKNISEVFKGSIKLEKLLRNKYAKQEFDRLTAHRKTNKADYAFLPLSGRDVDLVWVWDKTNKSPIGFISVDPWKL